jgi:hypothetical protein
MFFVYEESVNLLRERSLANAISLAKISPCSCGSIILFSRHSRGAIDSGDRIDPRSIEFADIVTSFSFEPGHVQG